ncbi:MAG: GNAT family N-acetyltransferase [Candidatus Doudnabacteria bacterium]|nr:GNAT family N-acetyltransferase [Candidatus Doudnabacteria bacterium]
MIQKKNIKSKAIKLEAKEGRKIVGRAFLYLIKNDLHKERYGLLEDVFVEEAYRKNGLGAQLVEGIIKEARRQKCYKLLATSRMERSNIHKYYEKFGFKKHGFEFRMELK